MHRTKVAHLEFFHTLKKIGGKRSKLAPKNKFLGGKKRVQYLPIGIQSFEKIRLNNYLYVDKTKQILQLIQSGECYFLSRPRRFGKSLTLSTLEAMFKGKAELFKGLYAEEWVKEQSKHPNPVIKLDMGDLGNYETTEEFKSALIDYLGDIIDDYDLNIKQTIQVVYSLR